MPPARSAQGPATYSSTDVAQAFAQALGRDVRTVETPRAEWVAALRALGFSAVAAGSYARMLAITVDGAERPEAPERGDTTLLDHVRAIVHRH
jgi:hypothetical protein